jgi:3-oxoacyl-[acyl-carrier-protein] synthase II
MRGPAAVTGLGPVSAIGTGVEAFWEGLVAGRSGIGPLTRCAPPRRGCAIAAEVAEPAARALDPAHPEPRAVAMAIAAARLAYTDAAVGAEVAPERVGVVVGTGVGNLDVIESALEQMGRGARLSPVTAFRAFSHAAAVEIARELDLRGPVATLTSGCNSGMDALGLALDWVRLGRADIVLVGGTEAELTPGFLAMMTAARALAVRFNDRPTEAMRPFDRARDGNVPGEGAGFLVLESLEHAARRGARVRALLEGVANQAVGRREQYDPFNPVFNPAPMLRAMRAALDDAGIDVGAISTVSANGSSSVFYDTVEATALVELLGGAAATVPVHSVKSVLGQTGAVIPALQAIAAALTVERGVIPPTMNVGELDPRCPIALVRDAPLERPVDHVLLNAIGFGGFYYASAVIGRAAAPGATRSSSR